MADVFISYHVASGRGVVRQIAEELRKRGITYWYSEMGISGGEDFARTVPPQIESCRVFLLLLDEGAVGSVHTENELGLAFQHIRKIKILPFRVGKCVLSDWMRYYLTHIQIMNNALMLPLDKRIEELADYIEQILNNDRGPIKWLYQSEQVEEDTVIQECKVIFLGDGGAGKTSLIKRIMYNKFQLGEQTTEGVRIIPWDTELDGEPFRLRFMDFGGQEIMHSMHRCFLSDHTIYVVVCAIRDDIVLKTAVVRWLEQVKSYAPNCPVILALNKADENPRISVDETALMERYPALKKVLKTSAAEQGSPFFAEFLYDAIMEQAPSCVQDWRGDKGMLDVKRALENMKENHIKAEEYRKICEDNGVKEENVQNSLLDWFRDLGVAYFYKRKAYDRALESLRVLNPEWLTNGIYRLILRTERQGKNGVLSHEDIRAILGKPFKGDAREDVVYSGEETEFILHVMRIFEISHEIPDEGKELIPMLMKEKTPPTAKASKKDALHLLWEGAFLPNNLIHKLMIRKFEELDFQCMWRVGARFKAPTGDCVALAEMTDDKTLDVYVSGGDAEERREYMKTFQDKVEDILKGLNLTDATKKYLCCIKNGKEGKVLYKDLLVMWKHGDKEFLLSDIQEYASPEALLQMADTDPKHWKPRILPDVSDSHKEKESAETWNVNLKNILLVFAIIVILILLAKGADLLELLKILLGSE